MLPSHHAPVPCMQNQNITPRGMIEAGGTGADGHTQTQDTNEVTAVN